MSTDSIYSRKNAIIIFMGLFMLSISKLDLAPFFLSFGITFIVSYDFKVRNKHSGGFYSGVVLLSLVLMFVLEYFLVPIHSVLFYVLLVTLSVGWFLTFHVSFNYTSLNQKGKILTWMGIILFLVSFFCLMSFNDIVFALIMIIVLSVSLVVLLITVKD